MVDDRGRVNGWDDRAATSAVELAHLRLVELEAVIQAIPDGVYIGDLGGIRHCNRPALDLLGYDTLEDVNRNIGTLMAELQARDASGRLLAVEDNVFVRALHGESATMDVVVRHRRRGEDRWLRSSAAPIRAGGIITGAVAVNVDVTAERRAAQELRTQRAVLTLEREVLALVAEGAPLDPVVAALARGLEQLASPGLLASVLVVEDGRVRHIAAPSLPAAWCAAIEGAPIGPRAGSCGTAAFRGERVVVTDIATDPLWTDYRDLALAHGLRACWSQPITSSHGDVMGTVALYYREPRSPTEAELAVIDGSARVARIILERHRDDVARDRAERERDQMLAELRETVRYNEVLIGILGHDLRNPLTAVITGTEVALRLDPDAARREALTGVVASGKRMARMIDQLLDLTRTRTHDGLPVRREPTNLAAVVRSAVAEVELTFPGRRVMVEAVGDTSGGWDGDRLWQVCSNLLCNALGHGLATSPVRVRLDGSAPDRVRLEVHNAGAIPEAVLPWLFDPFRRGPSNTAASRGLGLGLYITRQIARAHGGDVAVRSTVADGTTFTVALPR